MKSLLKDMYKTTVPRVLDTLGIYDKNINNTQHKYIVPMYHRVIQNPGDDPYALGMCVTENTFIDQLKYFSENFKSISLPEYCTSRHDLENDETTYVTLTFDDGYKDNLLNALPIIKKYQLNATIFVCTKIFDTDTNYWWDSIINAFNASNKSSLDLDDLGINGLGDQVRLDANKNKNIRHLLTSLWKNNSYKDESLIKEIVSRLLDGQKEPVVGHLTEEEVKSLSDNGVEIAAHTLTHYDLTSLDLKQAQYEIEKSKSIVTDIIGKDVHGFAYPAGFKNESIMQLVNNAGFDYAVSTDSGVNYTYKPFAIERIGMPQTNLSDLKRCVSNYSNLN